MTDALRISVETQFADNWTATDITDETDFGDNNRFTPPQDSEWVRVITSILSTQNAEVGKDFQRSIGIITVECYAPINTGEKALNDLIDSVKTIFQNKSFGGVECFATTPVRIGERGNWYQINAKTDFKYDVFS